MGGQPTRRDVLRWTGHGLAALPLGALVACGNDPSTGLAARPAGATSSTAAPAASLLRGRTDGKWWLEGNFAPVAAEVEAFDLPVLEGAIPTDLTGLYARNGSNPITGDSDMWFFGDGMVHGVSLAAGKADWYRNRYVDTPLMRGRIGFGQTAPGGETNQSNVSMISHGGRLLSSGEIGLPYELDDGDLHTIGAHDFGGGLNAAFTAHPKIDPTTGNLHAFGYGFAPPYLTYHVIDPNGALIHAESVDVGRSTMMHDFMITDRDVIFMDLPCVFDIDAAAAWIADPTSSSMPFQWKPETGARLGVMPLGGPATDIAWYDLDPCYVFHTVNAYRDGTDIVMDVCRLESLFEPDDPGIGTGPSLRRWVLDTEAAVVADTIVEEDNPGELPSRDPRRVGLKHRFGYLVESYNDERETPAFGGLIKHDYDRGSREVWTPPAGQHCGEWLFVAGNDAPTGPAAAPDDEGYLLTYLYDSATDASQLVIVDATDVAAGPVARVGLPQRVPFGFHAAWHH